MPYFRTHLAFQMAQNATDDTRVSREAPHVSVGITVNAPNPESEKLSEENFTDELKKASEKANPPNATLEAMERGHVTYSKIPGIDF